jgi:hypothetical protein
MIKRATLVWDDQRDYLVDDGMGNHDENSDTAYLRLCVEFYEEHKNESKFNAQLILEYLLEVRNMLKKGILISSNGDQEIIDEQAEIFDDILEQMQRQF